jgi:hypothetical protein
MLFKFNANMLSHCAFIFTNVPQNINSHDLFEQLKHKSEYAQESLNELEEQLYFLDLSAQKDGSEESIKNYKNAKIEAANTHFLQKIFEKCMLDCQLANANNICERLFSLRSIDKKELAIEDYCKIRFPKANFDFVREIANTISSWCNPLQISLDRQAVEISELRQQVLQLQQMLLAQNAPKNNISSATSTLTLFNQNSVNLQNSDPKPTLPSLNNS